jgi:nucleoside-diphosphate-sugar epimerase
MKNILISGGAGYLGTELTKCLLKDNNVVVFDKFYFPWLKKNKNKISNSKRLTFIKKDITNIKEKDFKNIDIVCDLNGIPNDPAAEINPKFTWDINYRGRLNFAKVAKKAGVKRYVFNSTCSVYGYNKNKVNERSKQNPISTYAKANLKSERGVYKLKSKSFKVNVLRNSTLFGFSNVLRLDLVINIFVYNLLKNKDLLIDGDGKQYRPFISLSDICKVYDHLIKTPKLPSFTCNLVAFNSTIKKLAELICKIMKNKKSKIIFNKNTQDARNYFVESVNFKKYFGTKFKLSSFSREINRLKKLIAKKKIRVNDQTIRMRFYKKLL